MTNPSRHADPHDALRGDPIRSGRPGLYSWTESAAEPREVLGVQSRRIRLLSWTVAAILILGLFRSTAPMPFAGASASGDESIADFAFAARAPSSPHAGKSAGVPAADLGQLSDWLARRYRISDEATREFVAVAFREGERFGLDPLLILAVMAVESRFNPVAQSDSGAVGLMQVIPRYHAEKIDAVGGASLLDPPANIRVGAQVLKEYIVGSGSEVAGLQRYGGASYDAASLYANRVIEERSRLRRAIQRPRSHA